MPVCWRPGCAALAEPDSRLCAVHRGVARRVKGDAVLHCYACGKNIRIGALWFVRAEGCFHLKADCLNIAPADYRHKVTEPITTDNGA